MSAQSLSAVPQTLHRPPSPLYRDLERKKRIYKGQDGILEIDYGTGLFGIEFPSGGDDNLDIELVKTSRRFPLAGVERFQTTSSDYGCKVFYFDASASFARGSGLLTFSQTVMGHKRVYSTKIRLEVE